MVVMSMVIVVVVVVIVLDVGEIMGGNSAIGSSGGSGMVSW